jgi:MFS family permease
MLGNPNPTMTGLVTAIYDIGCALGCVAAFVWGEKLGRKKSIIAANLIVIVGAAIQTASFDYWQMFVSRVIGGVGVGFSTVAVPIRKSPAFISCHCFSPSDFC